jgi:hypothetical protein
MSRQHRVVQAAAVAATITGLAVPAAGAQDLRSPDVQDSAAAAQQRVGDLRSPDVQDVAGAAHRLSTPASDLRSPDVQDAASRIVSSVTPPAPVTEPSASDGFAWGDAAIGAGAAVAAIALAGGVMLAGRRRHASVPHIAH